MFHVEQLGKAYGAVATRYIELFGNAGSVDPNDLSMIVRHLIDAPGPVLDVGCGPGHLTSHLRSVGVETFGIDLVPAFVDHATSTYRECRYLVGSMEALPFGDGSVAGALAWYSLVHVRPERFDALLSELCRVVVPGGRLVIGLFEGPVVAAFDHQVAQAWTWTLEEVLDHLFRAGCTLVDRWHRPGLDVPGHRPHLGIVAEVR